MTTSAAKLDSCEIALVPNLNKEHEYFSSPAALIGTLGLDFETQENGLILKGTYVYRVHIKHTDFVENVL